MNSFAGRDGVKVCPSKVTLEYDLAEAGDKNPDLMAIIWKKQFKGNPQTLNRELVMPVVRDASGGIPLGQGPRRYSGKRTVRSAFDERPAPAQSPGGRGLRKQARIRRRSPRHAGRRAVPEMFNARHQANVAQEAEARFLLRVLSLVSQVPNYLHD